MEESVAQFGCAKEPRSKDLPVLRSDSLEKAWRRTLPWLQVVTGPSRRLYMSPDRRTYILDPLVRIWKELITKTIAFTGPSAAQEWKNSRVYKYVVRKDDVGKSASDMKFYMDTVRGEDYVIRADFEPSSSESDSPPAGSQSPSTSPSAPPAASTAAQDRPAAPKEETSDTKEGPSETVSQTPEASSPQGDSKRIKTTAVTMPPLVLPQTASVAPAPISLPTLTEATSHPDLTEQEERPVKRRVVFAQVYFRYGPWTKPLFEQGKLRTSDIEMAIYSFLMEKDASNDVLWCACKDQLYKVQDVNTVIVDFKLADVCLEKFKDLPWPKCKVLGGKGIYANSEPTADEYAQLKVGVWIPVEDEASGEVYSSSSSNSSPQPPLPPPRASPCTERATPATTPELERDQSASSRREDKAYSSTAAKSS